MQIVNEAKQEQKIERDLRSIADKWTTTTYTVTKYVKNGEVRGFVIKASDDIKVDLDDHLLNLQVRAGAGAINCTGVGAVFPRSASRVDSDRCRCCLCRRWLAVGL